MTQKLPRRTVLRGLGTMMALPLLEAMAPAELLAAGAAKTYPTRLAFVFVPNGIHMPAWRPANEGPLAEMPSILEPLAPVKDEITVLTGLAQHNGFALGDGAGDHARSAASYLTGCHPKKTAGADIKNGVSVDQVAARVVGRHTRFPSLELGCERGAQNGNCDSGYSCAYSSNISWRSESTPMAKEVDPRLAFDRLFGSEDPQEKAEVRAKRYLYRKSILDFVADDAGRLNKQLGVRDQEKLDEYLTGVREIEKRIASATTVDFKAAGIERPTGIPKDFGEHIDLMYDIMFLAFQADVTRVATLMIANDGSNRPYPMINVSAGHHDLSHHGGDAAKQEGIRQINRFHIEQFGKMLEKMKKVREGDGTLLDHVMIAYGAGISDGNRHNHDDLPMLLAGRGSGTINAGRHLKYAGETPMNNLFLSLLDRMKVPAVSIGDSTGRLNNLG